MWKYIQWLLFWKGICHIVQYKQLGSALEGYTLHIIAKEERRVKSEAHISIIFIFVGGPHIPNDERWVTMVFCIHCAERQALTLKQTIPVESCTVFSLVKLRDHRLNRRQDDRVRSHCLNTVVSLVLSNNWLANRYQKQLAYRNPNLIQINLIL